MVIQLKQDTLEQSTKPIIIDAFASWCPHCTKMRPIFEELEKEFGDRFSFAAFDVDESPELAEQLNVMSLPTFIFIKDKKEVRREMGEIPHDDLKKFIETYLE